MESAARHDAAARRSAQRTIAPAGDAVNARAYALRTPKQHRATTPAQARLMGGVGRC
jgi:hypothetical protein